MSKTDFFVLSPPRESRQFAEWDHGIEFSGPITCPVNPEHQRPGPRKGDLRIVLPGSTGDFVWTWYGECLIRDHVLSAFEAAEVTGFHTKPVFVRTDDNSVVPPNLHELVVRGWGGFAPLASGITIDRQHSCEACNHYVYSAFRVPKHLVDISQWDGSDLFFVWPLPRYVFCTAKVARLVAEFGWQGVDVRELAELEPTGHSLTPGKLTDWLSLEKARAIQKQAALFSYETG